MPLSNTARDWHVDRPLTNLSIALTQSTTQFIAPRVGTLIPVNKESDKYTVYPQGYWNREYDSTRAEEGVANSVNYKTKQENYSIGDKALRIFISDRKRANADSQFSLDREGMALVSNSLLIGEEIDFRDKFLVAGKWSKDLTGVAASPTGNQFLKWSNAASDPVGDYKVWRRDFVLRSAGKMPNEINMTLDVFDTLTEHPAIMDRIKTTGVNQAATISREQLAGLFQVNRINVIQTIVNTANDSVEDAEGETLVNNTFLASGLFLPVYTEPTGGLLSATAIGNFYLPAFTGAQLGPRFRRYRAVEGKDGEYIEGQLRVDRRIVAKDLGQLWLSVL